MPDASSTTELPEDAKPGMLFGAVATLALTVVLAVGVSWADRLKVETGSFLGPFHFVILHFPPVLVVLAAGLEAAWWWRGGVELRRIIFWLMQLTVASSLLAVGLGILLSRQGDYDSQLVQTHRNYGLAVMWTSVLALALLTWANHLESRRLGHGFHVVLVGVLVLVVLVGHTGGRLSHGSQFFLKNAPPFLQSWLGGTSDQSIRAGQSSDMDERFSLDIWPILEARCVKCHGPEKQKGELRVDDRELLLAGGESEEPALVPGDPAASSLIRLVLLPEDDDDVMPQEGKGRVTREEAMKLIEWIQDGAAFSKKLAQPPPHDRK